MDKRIEEEKVVVRLMIRMYCRRHEGNRTLCPKCRELTDYGSRKPTCKKCPVHCYKPEMKERIRTIMRWAGPRMIIYHPVAAIRHLLRELK